jgi:hypothetical protein
MIIANHGTQDDALTAMSTPRSVSAELDGVLTDDKGIVSMRPVASVPIPAGGKTILGPTGAHGMLDGVNGGMKAGDTFPITLTFEKAGTINASVSVIPASQLGQAIPPDTASPEYQKGIADAKKRAALLDTRKSWLTKMKERIFGAAPAPTRLHPALQAGSQQEDHTAQ